MTQTEGPEEVPATWEPSPAEAVAHRVQELRRGRGWSAERLAQECARVGLPHLNRPVIANLEAGRRASISVDELFALAYVLDVAPVHLLVPTEERVSRRRVGPAWITAYHVTPTITASLDDVREWVLGEEVLPGVDQATFDAEQHGTRTRSEPTVYEIDDDGHLVPPGGYTAEMRDLLSQLREVTTKMAHLAEAGE